MFSVLAFDYEKITMIVRNDRQWTKGVVGTLRLLEVKEGKESVIGVI